MKKIFQIVSLVTLTTGLLCLSGFVQANQSATKTSKPAPATKTVVEDEAEPNVEQSKNFEYKCELGNSLTMYTNSGDQQHIAMRWKKRLYRMTRVSTSTGAHRFENQKAGFVFISIPAKGLLLDSHKGQQLANECTTPQPLMAEAQGILDVEVQVK
jgi:membrane-bound inhibitor of C-type lysozyme